MGAATKDDGGAESGAKIDQFFARLDRQKGERSGGESCGLRRGAGQDGGGRQRNETGECYAKR